jgi:hypothetical protein
MTQQPAKRIPQWLTIDLLVIAVSLAIISSRGHHRTGCDKCSHSLGRYVKLPRESKCNTSRWQPALTSAHASRHEAARPWVTI